MGVSLLRVRNTSRPEWPGWGVLGRQGGRQSQRSEGRGEGGLTGPYRPLQGFRLFLAHSGSHWRVSGQGVTWADLSLTEPSGCCVEEQGCEQGTSWEALEILPRGNKNGDWPSRGGGE